MISSSDTPLTPVGDGTDISISNPPPRDLSKIEAQTLLDIFDFAFKVYEDKRLENTPNSFPLLFLDSELYLYQRDEVVDYTIATHYQHIFQRIHQYLTQSDNSKNFKNFQNALTWIKNQVQEYTTIQKDLKRSATVELFEVFSRTYFDIISIDDQDPTAIENFKNNTQEELQKKLLTQQALTEQLESFLFFDKETFHPIYESKCDIYKIKSKPEGLPRLTLSNVPQNELKYITSLKKAHSMTAEDASKLFDTIKPYFKAYDNYNNTYAKIHKVKNKETNTKSLFKEVRPNLCKNSAARTAYTSFNKIFEGIINIINGEQYKSTWSTSGRHGITGTNDPFHDLFHCFSQLMKISDDKETPKFIKVLTNFKNLTIKALKRPLTEIDWKIYKNRINLYDATVEKVALELNKCAEPPEGYEVVSWRSDVDAYNSNKFLAPDEATFLLDTFGFLFDAYGIHFKEGVPVNRFFLNSYGEIIEAKDVIPLYKTVFNYYTAINSIKANLEFFKDPQGSDTDSDLKSEKRKELVSALKCFSFKNSQLQSTYEAVKLFKKAYEYLINIPSSPPFNSLKKSLDIDTKVTTFKAEITTELLNGLSSELSKINTDNYLLLDENAHQAYSSQCKDKEQPSPTPPQEIKDLMPPYKMSSKDAKGLLEFIKPYFEIFKDYENEYNTIPKQIYYKYTNSYVDTASVLPFLTIIPDVYTPLFIERTLSSIINKENSSLIDDSGYTINDAYKDLLEAAATSCKVIPKKKRVPKFSSVLEKFHTATKIAFQGPLEENYFDNLKVKITNENLTDREVRKELMKCAKLPDGYLTSKPPTSETASEPPTFKSYVTTALYGCAGLLLFGGASYALGARGNILYAMSVAGCIGGISTQYAISR